ncbi:alpha/beta hydrolase [Nocardia jejuensis]|uniref:alpha/beta hydrolase n=1 Tax=Nocardia jejuensis TaxID=328049 RepID=UPI0009FBE35D|nr:alpha/beta hydrolase family protein [Nocardia jejuensis]
MSAPREPRRRATVSRHIAFWLVIALQILTSVTGHAQPPDAPGSRLDHFAPVRERVSDMFVYSAAMNTVIRARVLRAADPDTPAPTLYLLNGANGGIDGSWYDETDVAEFFRDKQVNVVIPIGGAGTYFTDWEHDDPLLGRPRWTTFLTRELPPIVDTTLHGSGANAIAGISMAGTSAFQLALAAPGLYRAVGSYSGCVRTSDPQGQAFVAAVVARWRGNAFNMWGPAGDPAWPAHDPYLNAEGLRGTTIYISSGTGAPGPLDTLQGTHDDPLQLTWQLLFGTPLEAIMNQCTRALQARLHELDIPATVDLRPTGTHSWGYWQEDLHHSWPAFESALTK